MLPAPAQASTAYRNVLWPAEMRGRVLAANSHQEGIEGHTPLQRENRTGSCWSG
jgi:hypothetical protein